MKHYTDITPSILHTLKLASFQLSSWLAISMARLLSLLTKHFRLWLFVFDSGSSSLDLSRNIKSQEACKYFKYENHIFIIFLSGYKSQYSELIIFFLLMFNYSEIQKTYQYLLLLLKVMNRCRLTSLSTDFIVYWLYCNFYLFQVNFQ